MKRNMQILFLISMFFVFSTISYSVNFDYLNYNDITSDLIINLNVKDYLGNISVDDFKNNFDSIMSGLDIIFFDDNYFYFCLQISGTGYYNTSSDPNKIVFVGGSAGNSLRIAKFNRFIDKLTFNSFDTISNDTPNYRFTFDVNNIVYAKNRHNLQNSDKFIFGDSVINSIVTNIDFSDTETEDTVNPTPDNNFFSTFWDTLKGFFIPSSDYFQKFFDEIKKAFEEKTNGLSSSIDNIINGFRDISNLKSNNVGIKFDIPQNFLFQGFDGFSYTLFSDEHTIYYLNKFRLIVSAFVVIFTIINCYKHLIDLIRN